MLSKIKNPFFLLSLSLCFFILRMAIPFALFAYLVLLILTYIVNYKEIIAFFKNCKWKEFKIFYPFLATVLCFFIAILLDRSHETIVFKEAINIPLIIALLLLFIVFVNLNNIKQFIAIFFKHYIVCIAIVSVLALIKFYLQLKGIHLELLVNHDKYPWGFSLSTDYNFYSVAIFIGFLILMYGNSKTENLKYKILDYLLFALVCVNVFYSGSRRGILILFSIIAIQFCISMYHLIVKKKSDAALIKTIIGLLVILMQVYFLYFASFPVRKISAKAIGVYATPYKKEVTAISFRYITLLDPKADYLKMYKDMWPKEDFGNVDKEESIKTPVYEKTTYGSRLERWNFGFSLYSNKYSLFQKLFGNGFNYLKQFAIKFNVILFNSYDYPHNPLIASLLYAGIIGFLSLLFYLGYSVYLIYSLKLYNFIILASYILISFFSLLSGNSYFSIPIYVAVTLIPFYIKYLYNNHTNIKSTN